MEQVIFLYEKNDGKVTITEYLEKNELVVIPSEVKGCPVTRIGVGAFENSGVLAEVVIPNTITEIGASAFSGCDKLTAIDIPDTVQVIENSAFSGCTSLTKVRLPSTLSTLPGSMFYGCSSLKQIEIPLTVVEIGSFAFHGCSSLTDVVIPPCVTKINGFSFAYCTALETIEIANTATEIDDGAFERCSSLTHVYMLKHTKLSLDGVEMLDSAQNSGSTEVEVGQYGFEGCASWKDQPLPPSLARVGDCAFLDCSQLVEIAETTEPFWVAPEQTVDADKAFDDWNKKQMEKEAKANA